jgi:hypothetical protein
VVDVVREQGGRLELRSRVVVKSRKVAQLLSVIAVLLLVMGYYSYCSGHCCHTCCS